MSFITTSNLGERTYLSSLFYWSGVVFKQSVGLLITTNLISLGTVRNRVNRMKRCEVVQNCGALLMPFVRVR